jgi:hypothetical protein
MGGLVGDERGREASTSNFGAAGRVLAPVRAAATGDDNRVRNFKNHSCLWLFLKAIRPVLC